MPKSKIEWINGDKPPKPGMYRIQDTTLNCACCWIDAKFNGSVWLSNLHCPKDIFMNIMNTRIKRWTYPLNETLQN